MTRTLHALLVALVALLGSMPATAAPPHARGHDSRTSAPAGVEIHNQSGFALDLYVDGALRGRIERGAVETFSTLPGHRQVTLRTQREGWMVLDDRVRLDASRRTRLDVAPPRADLALVNDGEAPLFVTLTGSRDAFWMMPGEWRTVKTTAGRSLVTTSIYTPDGLVPLEHHDVVAVPGRTTTEQIGWTARSASTSVTLTNRENRTVRVYVSGREVAVIPARSTREFQVSPGQHHVVVAQHGGEILYDAPVTFLGRSRYTVEIRDGIRVATPRRVA